MPIKGKFVHQDGPCENQLIRLICGPNATHNFRSASGSLSMTLRSTAAPTAPSPFVQLHAKYLGGLARLRADAPVSDPPASRIMLPLCQLSINAI